MDDDVLTAKPDGSSKLILGCSLAFLALAIGALIFLGLGLPIQTDEVAWSFLNHRAILDHYTISSTLPSCMDPEHTGPLPLLWYIPSWINYLTFATFDHPVGFRVLGLLRLFGWLGLWLLVAWRLFRLTRAQLICSFAALLALFSLDVDFFLLFLDRPEQTLLLGASICTALVVFASSIAKTRLRIALTSILLLITIMQMGQTHAKAMVLAPFFTVASFRFARMAFSSRIAAWVISTVVLGILVYSHMVWLWRYTCANEQLKTLMADHTFPFGLILSDPLHFFTKLLHDFFGAMLLDLTPLSINIDWISFKHGAARAYSESPVFMGLFLIGYLIKLFLLMLTFVFTLRALFRRWKTDGTREGVSMQYECAILSFWLMVALFGWLGFQGAVRMFYYGAIEVPVLILASILVFGFYTDWQKRARWAYVTLLACGTVSLGYMLNAFQHPEQHEVIETARTISFSTKDYSERLPALKALAQSCSIDTEKSQHVIVDDETYLFMRHSFQPYHFHYATNLPFDRTVVKNYTATDLFNLMKRSHSDGVLTDCRNFLNPMMPYAQKSGGYCCISRETMEKAVKK